MGERTTSNDEQDEPETEVTPEERFAELEEAVDQLGERVEDMRRMMLFQATAAETYLVDQLGTPEDRLARLAIREQNVSDDHVDEG